MKTVYYDQPFRTMLDADLAEFTRAEARRDGITVSAVLRQALAERRARSREAQRQRHAAIEAEVAKVGEADHG